MPELPEVETIRRDLCQKILNKKIVKVNIVNPKSVRNSRRDFLSGLRGNKIKSIDRVGKLMVFCLPEKEFLLVHLKMTGQLIYKQGKKIIAGGHGEPESAFGRPGDKVMANLAVPNKHTRVIITFADKSKLFFNDLRLFGYMKKVGRAEKDKIAAAFGIEPLTRGFSLAKFAAIFKNRKTSLKAILLNQNLIAGLGNIYVDEVCFRAGLKPNRSAGNLAKTEIAKLYQAIQFILKKAIAKRGTTFNNYIDADGNKGNFIKYLQVYGQGGAPCKKCKNLLKKIRLSGRGTVFCEKCQK